MTLRAALAIVGCEQDELFCSCSGRPRAALSESRREEDYCESLNNHEWQCSRPAAPYARGGDSSLAQVWIVSSRVGVRGLCEESEGDLSFV